MPIPSARSLAPWPGTYAGFDAIPTEDIAVLENDTVFREYDVRSIAAGLEALIAKSAAHD